MRYVVVEGAESFCEGTSRSYSFVACVSRYGDFLLAQDLIAAYKRAVSTFGGSMEQCFIVLSEVEDLPVASGPNRQPVGHRGPRGGSAPFRGASRSLCGRKCFGSPQGTPSKKSNT